MMTIFDDHILGEHVALLFYDNRAASVDVLVRVGVGEGRKKKNLSPNAELATCNPFLWEADIWVFKTEETFRTSLTQRGAKVSSVFIICLPGRKTYTEL